MPASSHLQWFDIDDFTAGLWAPSAAYNKFAAPPNAFVTLDDYQPLKGGGIRPFFGSTVVDTSAIGATELPMGVFARSGVVRTGTGGTGNVSTDLVLVTLKPSDLKFRIYRLDGTVASPAWSLRYTSGAANDDGHKHVDFALFKDINGVEWLILSVYMNSGTEGGLLKMQYDYTVASNTASDGAVTVINHAFKGPMVVSQQRIIASSGHTLEISDTGLTTYVNALTLDVTPNNGEADIMGISGIDPSDMLIAKAGAPWVEINGDVTSTGTPVREMGNDHHVRASKQVLARTPGGVAFVEPQGRVFETDGRTFKSITDQIEGRAFTWTGNLRDSGTLSYLDGYLLIPGTNLVATGVIFDYNNGALFRTTQINPVFSWADPVGGVFYAANHSAPGTLVTIDIFAGTRVATGVIQTVPYADKNGRNIDIREVQIFALSAAASEFRVDLIDEDDSIVATRYAVMPSAHRELLKFQFPATKSEYLSVRITPRSVNGTAEAPTIERLRIGFGINNLVT